MNAACCRCFFGLLEQKWAIKSAMVIELGLILGNRFSYVLCKDFARK